MNKVRVHELAKELELTSKDLIEKIESLGIKVSSHMSTLKKDEANLVKELLLEESKANNKKDTGNNDKGEFDINNNIDVNNNEEVEEQAELENVIKMGTMIQVKELAEKMDVGSSEVIGKLIPLGVMASMNQEIDYDTASLVADEFEFNLVMDEDYEEEEEESLEEVLAEELDFEDKEEDMVERSPVVTVMGHVDHGKTSLLDSIRRTSVIDREAGGITQHIGAYTVEIQGKKITFLDTPGHEAFTSMRARGAQITDITILVVAADDGVMPQTIEALNHAKAADVPIIVAINKMDKEGANPDRIKQELMEHGLTSEDWGGDTIFVEISAKKNEGIEDILEMILLVSEVQELKANPNRKAVGTIIESNLDKGRGPVATLLIQKGTLSVGDSIVAGAASGRIRAMIDDKGERIKTAGPSTPVEILGLCETPNSGDRFYMMKNEKEAKKIASRCKIRKKDDQVKAYNTVSLENLFDTIQEGEMKNLNIIIKADVKGAVEAMKQSLEKLSTPEVKVSPIHGGVGAIVESDIMLASASNAIVIGFNVRPTVNAMDVAKSESVDIRTYTVIYKAIEDIKDATIGMLDPEFEEIIKGRAEVRATFKVPNAVIAGVYITQGKVERSNSVRLLRDNIVIHEGEISSLRRFKDDVRELATSYEGGIGIEGYDDIKEGDEIEAFAIEEIKRK